MNPSNRTIEEKLAIVQQLKGNSSGSSQSKINPKQNIDAEEKSPYLTLLIIRCAICLMIFGSIIWLGSKNPTVTQYIHAMITTEENGNLIDFMSPFTYTLQENVERTSETDAESENKDTLNMDMSSEE